MEKISTYKKWTPKETTLLQELNGKISFEEMAEKHFLNRTPKALQKKSLKIGLTSSYKHKKYTHNKEFFKIPNKLNSYWAGWFCGRAYRSGKNQVAIEARPEDTQHLEQLKRNIQYTGNVNIYSYQKFNNNLLTKSPRLNLCGANDIIDDLTENFGFTSSKGDRLFPKTINSNFELSICFLIGLLDSDGYISVSKINDSNYKGRIHFSVFSFELARWINEAVCAILRNSNISTKSNQYETISSGASRYDLVYYARGCFATSSEMLKVDVPFLKRKLGREDLKDAVLFYQNH